MNEPTYKQRMQAKYPPIGKRLQREYNTKDLTKAIGRIREIGNAKRRRMETLIAGSIAGVIILLIFLVMFLWGMPL